MQYTRIQNTDLKVSAVALGTWVFGSDFWGGSSERDCADAVAAAYDWGVNLIDTAPFYGYGLAERIVGRAIKGKRAHFVIATKCGLVGRGKAVQHDLSPESIRAELEDSLARLQVDCVDLYQCHWPDPETPIETTLEAMVKLKEQGKIRHIGVSNFGVDLLKRAVDYTSIATLQSQYSLLERSLEKEVLPFIRQKGVGLLAYGPLAGGILTGKYTEEPRFKGADARDFFYKFYHGEAFARAQRILAALKSAGKPLNQAAVNWVRQQEGVAAVIVGCRDAKQVEQNALAANWDFNREQLAALERSLEPSL